jgi:hypothetical protein
VPAIRNLLDRFRPAGTPGAPGLAGVPVDRRARAADELEPVFAGLADLTTACRAARTHAAQEAEHRRADARERARVLVARAHAEADAERAAARASAVAEGDADAERIAAAGALRSHDIAADAQRSRAALVDRILARLRSDIVGLDGDQP